MASSIEFISRMAHMSITRITSTAVLFAKTSLHMQASSLILIGIITSLSGIHFSGHRFNARSPFLTSLSWTFLSSLRPSSLYTVAFCFQVSRSDLAASSLLGKCPILLSSLVQFMVLSKDMRERFKGSWSRGEKIWFISDHGQEQFVSWSIGGGCYCGSGRYALLFLVGMIRTAVPLLCNVDAEKGRVNARNYVYRELTWRCASLLAAIVRQWLTALTRGDFCNTVHPRHSMMYLQILWSGGLSTIWE